MVSLRLTVGHLLVEQEEAKKTCSPLNYNRAKAKDGERIPPVRCVCDRFIEVPSQENDSLNRDEHTDHKVIPFTHLEVAFNAVDHLFSKFVGAKTHDSKCHKEAVDD